MPHSFILELPQAPIIFIMHLEMRNLSSHTTWFLRFYKIAFFTYAYIKRLIESMIFFSFCNLLNSIAVSKKVNVIFPIFDFSSKTEFNKGLSYRVNKIESVCCGLVCVWDGKYLEQETPFLTSCTRTDIANQLQFPWGYFSTFQYKSQIINWS